MSRTIAKASLEDALERAAWAEADVSLATAWREAVTLQVELDRLSAAFAKAGAGRPPAALRALEEAADRAAFLAQAVERVAMMRRMRLGDVGKAVFDPERHAPRGARGIEPGASVRVHAPGVIQERAGGERVLVRADVAPTPRARRAD